jgi:UDP-glucose 4-epimerase
MRKQRRVHDLLFGPAREAGIDTLVHTSKVHSAQREGAAVHAYNVESFRAILDFAERHPTIKRLVLCSGAEVYQVQRDLPSLIAEQHPLNMNEGAPQWIRDRVEADVMACTRMGLGSLKIAVLRMAEILAPGSGSQFYDYVQNPICLCPIGFDPMLNFLTQEDAASALQKAIHSKKQGVFNIPGTDTLPLYDAIAKWGRIAIPTPSFIALQFYRVRRILRRGDFRYGMNRRRFHFTGILDGRRASEILGYIPAYPINWPVDIVE